MYHGLIIFPNLDQVQQVQDDLKAHPTPALLRVDSSSLAPIHAHLVKPFLAVVLPALGVCCHQVITLVSEQIRINVMPVHLKPCPAVGAPEADDVGDAVE